jgi:SPP1 gp7 family putative phage head morphogenesis protein
VFEFSEAYIEELLRGVWNGEITEHDLPEDLYLKIADVLKKGLYSGFGISFSQLTKEIEEGISTVFDQADLELLTELRENCFLFAGAKVYQQTKDMRGLIMGEDGIKSWQEFKKDAGGIFDTYNSSWLSAEYDTAIGQAQNAVHWNNIEKNKELMPYLQYEATEDELECEICAPFNDAVAPVDDPIWDIALPMQHYNCRCTVLQIDKYEEVELTPDNEKDELINNAKEVMDPVFQMNAGKDKVVFNENHPYFSVAKGDKEFAKKNFGLNIPETD